MLGRMTTMYKMSQAAVVVQNLLEQHSTAIFRVDAEKLSSRWVAVIYDSKPDLLGGKFGQRPHKISVAAVALAQGLSSDLNEDVQAVAQAALGSIMADVAANAAFYPFNGIDKALIELAEKHYIASLSESALGNGSMRLPSESSNQEPKSSEAFMQPRPVNPEPAVRLEPVQPVRSARSDDLRRRIEAAQNARLS